MADKQPDYGAAAVDLFKGAGGVASDYFGALGSNASAKAYTDAATVSKEQTAISKMQETRKLMQIESGTKASAAGSGFSFSGSAQDVMRDTANQGAIANAAISHQGAMEFESYTEQAKAAKQAANSQKASGIAGILTTVAEVALAVVAL